MNSLSFIIKRLTGSAHVKETLDMSMKVNLLLQIRCVILQLQHIKRKGSLMAVSYTHLLILLEKDKDFLKQ